jgi:hypothetical protein
MLIGKSLVRCQGLVEKLFGLFFPAAVEMETAALA